MPAYAGMAPWNQYKAVQGDQYTKKGNFKSMLKDGNGMEWDLSTGWHFERPKKSGTVHRTCKTITGTDGKRYKIYSYDGYDDYIGFRSSDNPDSDKMAYAEEAFANEKDCIKQDGVGHITLLEYSPGYQVLRVTFEDGSICVFFRVPSAVAGELFSLAQTKRTQGMHTSGSKRGQPKHLLGIRFWDLVRIRGMQHGARYPFEYEHHSTESLISQLPRHTITLTKEVAKLIDEAGTYSTNLDTVIKHVLNGNIKPGDKISSVLTEDELAEYIAKMRDLKSKLDQSILEDLPDIKDIDQAASYIQLGSMTLDRYGQMQFEKSERDARLQALQELMGDEKAKKYYDQRNAKLKQQIINNLGAEAEAVVGKGFISAWKNEYAPEGDLVFSTMGKVWTKQDLIDFGNTKDKSSGPKIGALDAPAYNRYIQCKDWTGALNYLKGHSRSLRYGKRNLGKQQYASEQDTLDLEE